MRAHRRAPSANMPFWLLIAAWVCANVPAVITLNIFLWVKGAEHFSHYAELRQNVASLVFGKSGKASPRLAAAESARRSLPPTLPSGGMLKKIDLALATGLFQMIALQTKPARPFLAHLAPGDPVTEVPYPPPRVREQA